MKIAKIAGITLLIFLGLTVFGGMLGFIGDTAAVAKKEFGPSASLKKYEWFKDTSFTIKKLNSDISIYEDKQIICIGQTNRITMEQCMLWSQELAGIKSAYNDTVAEYNSQSSKFNWSMYNIDSIPTSFKEH